MYSCLLTDSIMKFLLMNFPEKKRTNEMSNPVQTCHGQGSLMARKWNTSNQLSSVKLQHVNCMHANYETLYASLTLTV